MTEGVPQPGDVLSLTIEKPAAGGRMIARADGMVVLVGGVIPGESADVQIERVAKGVAYGRPVDVRQASPDRVAVDSDPQCGGCDYAHIAYSRQLALKAQVIVDAFARIGRIPWTADIPVAPSPEREYRMRARLHFKGRDVGFYREGSHQLCDARRTGQLTPASIDAAQCVVAALAERQDAAAGELEVSENIDGSERVIHIEATLSHSPGDMAGTAKQAGLTGLTLRSADQTSRGALRILNGDPCVHDRVVLDGHEITLRRHVLSFFQGNRFLLPGLVQHVVDAVPADSEVVDLYAGVGLFSVAAAVVRSARVTAVEGDMRGAADLSSNASASRAPITPVHCAVEDFSWRGAARPAAVIVDPPRTGMSKEALRRTLALGASRIVYVSCDVATLARDARQIVESGYAMADVRAFDLFPRTSHVETVARFERTR